MSLAALADCIAMRDSIKEQLEAKKGDFTRINSCEIHSHFPFHMDSDSVATLHFPFSCLTSFGIGEPGYLGVPMSDAERKELRQNYGEALFEKFMDRLSKPDAFKEKAKCWSCSKVKQSKDCDNGWLVSV